MWLTLLFLGCDPVVKATDLCRERRSTLDGLYADYGGAEIAKGDGLLAGAIQGADRTRFEDMCVELGKGGTPTALGTKAREFLAKDSTARTCSRVVDIDRKVAAINDRLPAGKRVTCS